jgi:hypothetical protein
MTGMGKRECMQSFNGKPSGKCPLGTSRRQDDNIKMNNREIGMRIDYGQN